MKKAYVILVAIGILASFLSALPNETEGFRNRSVEIAVDFEEVRILSEDRGITVYKTLLALKDAGATAVGLRETNIRRYVAEGKIAIFQGGEILNALSTGLLENPDFAALRNDGRISPNYTYIITEDIDMAQRLLLRLNVAFGRQTEMLKSQTPYIIEIKAPRASVETFPVGLDADDLQMLQNLGLRVVGRPANVFMGSEAALTKILNEYANLPEGLLSALVFDGIEAAGFPDYLDEAAGILSDNGIRVGFVELVRRQSGIEQLMSLTNYSGVTVHSNMRGRPVASIVNAVMERGARLLYLRFHIERRPASLEDAALFVEDVKGELARYGFYTGESSPLGGGGRWQALHIISMLGLAAASALMIIEMKIYRSRLTIYLPGVLFVFLAGIYILSPDLSLQLSAILSALVFSTLAFVSQTVNRLNNKHSSGFGFVALTILRTFVAAVLGGIMVAGFHSTPYFTSGAALFRGVVLTNVLPFIPIIWILYARYTKDASEWTIASVVRKLSTPLKSNITWLHLILFGIVAVVLYVYAARMGHQAGMTLLPLEDQMRRLLDEILIVRPRTKEFLIAYPAFILGLTLYVKGNTSFLSGVLMAVGALAPISVINTFMHFTNPTLLASATLRSFNGLLLGVFFGVALVIIWNYAEKTLKKWGIEVWA